jgi:pSer/pThr/pTyr-binding forkhead associated (FHA) protein
MDDHRPARGFPFQAPREITPPAPAGFVPLGLVLLPSGMRVDLTKPNTLVGRHSSADVRLPLPDVSRQHCRFIFQHSAWNVLDLDSLNGVFVNNERVQRAVLHQGDRVRVGGFVFQVELPATYRAAADTAKIAASQQVSTLRKDQRRAS